MLSKIEAFNAIFVGDKVSCRRSIGVIIDKQCIMGDNHGEQITGGMLTPLAVTVVFTLLKKLISSEDYNSIGKTIMRLDIKLAAGGWRLEGLQGWCNVQTALKSYILFTIARRLIGSLSLGSASKSWRRQIAMPTTTRYFTSLVLSKGKARNGTVRTADKELYQDADFQARCPAIDSCKPPNRFATNGQSVRRVHKCPNRSGLRATGNVTFSY
ncbi:hypothetical protein J6590_016818 [Homalodisca vitripennis]|nr:hypothetical protein J6590_016818 [Homalodisca vitripennis]